MLQYSENIDVSTDYDLQLLVSVTNDARHYTLSSTHRYIKCSSNGFAHGNCIFLAEYEYNTSLKIYRVNITVPVRTKGAVSKAKFENGKVGKADTPTRCPPPQSVKKPSSNSYINDTTNGNIRCNTNLELNKNTTGVVNIT